MIVVREAKVRAAVPMQFLCMNQAKRISLVSTPCRSALSLGSNFMQGSTS